MHSCSHKCSIDWHALSNLMCGSLSYWQWQLENGCWLGQDQPRGATQGKFAIFLTTSASLKTSGHNRMQDDHWNNQLKNLESLDMRCINTHESSHIFCLASCMPLHHLIRGIAGTIPALGVPIQSWHLLIPCPSNRHGFESNSFHGFESICA